MESWFEDRWGSSTSWLAQVSACGTKHIFIGLESPLSTYPVGLKESFSFRIPDFVLQRKIQGCWVSTHRLVFEFLRTMEPALLTTSYGKGRYGKGSYDQGSYGKSGFGYGKGKGDYGRGKGQNGKGTGSGKGKGQGKGPESQAPAQRTERSGEEDVWVRTEVARL